VPTAKCKAGLFRATLQRLRRWTSAAASRFALNLLFPPRCARCDADLGQSNDELLLCRQCQEALTPEAWSGCRRCGATTPRELPARQRCAWCEAMRLRMDRAVVLGPYQDEFRNVVLEMKRSANEPLAAAVAQLYWRHRQDALRELRADLVIPVPMHWMRRLVRGTNSPDTLAVGLAGQLGLAVAGRVLYRCRNTLPQANLSPTKRFQNVRGAFRLRAGYDLRGARVLLVDDILTTGATCS